MNSTAIKQHAVKLPPPLRDQSDKFMFAVYERVAVERLAVDDPELQQVWQWLRTRCTDTDARQFVRAALQAFELAKLTRKQLVELRRESAYSALDCLVRSRQHGRQSSFLRAFVMYLEQLGFPLRSPGAHAHIATIGRSLLNDDSLAASHVSKIVREFVSLRHLLVKQPERYEPAETSSTPDNKPRNL